MQIVQCPAQRAAGGTRLVLVAGDQLGFTDQRLRSLRRGKARLGTVDDPLRCQADEAVQEHGQRSHHGFGSAPRGGPLGARLGRKAFALGLLARRLARPADGFALLAGALLGGLLIGPPALHLAKQAFALELLLQDLEGLLDVVVSDEYLQGFLLCSGVEVSGVGISMTRGHGAAGTQVRDRPI